MVGKLVKGNYSWQLEYRHMKCNTNHIYKVWNILLTTNISEKYKAILKNQRATTQSFYKVMPLYIYMSTVESLIHVFHTLRYTPGLHLSKDNFQLSAFICNTTIRIKTGIITNPSVSSKKLLLLISSYDILA